MVKNKWFLLACAVVLVSVWLFRFEPLTRAGGPPIFLDRWSGSVIIGSSAIRHQLW